MQGKLYLQANLQILYCILTSTLTYVMMALKHMIAFHMFEDLDLIKQKLPSKKGRGTLGLNVRSFKVTRPFTNELNRRSLIQPTMR